MKAEPAAAPDVGELVAALEDGKAADVVALNIAEYSDFADVMIIATGRSARHLKALTDNLLFKLKRQGYKPTVEGEVTADWILIDVGDVLVHLFQPEARQLYNLEKLWGDDSAAKNMG